MRYYTLTMKNVENRLYFELMATELFIQRFVQNNNQETI